MRWILLLLVHYLNVQYKPGLKNQVPGAFYMWIEEGRKDAEVHQYIPKFESDGVPTLMRSQKYKSIQPDPE